MAAASTEFKPGQVWSYHTRSGEIKSRAVILKVEELHGKDEPRVLIHVYVGGLSLKTVLGGTRPAIPHMVFTEDAFRASVVKLLGETTSFPTARLLVRTVGRDLSPFSIPIATAIDILEKSRKFSKPTVVQPSRN